MTGTLLNQENNRLDYGKILQPDMGYRLDFAVGLTYSLDLEALLGVPVALGMLDDIDSAHKNNPFYLLEAIRKSSDRIAIFCNAGCIKLPRHTEPVFALLENSVFQVKLNPGANFHPKVWVVRYKDEEGAAYIKVIVLSRNLTFDRSLDVALEMTGAIGKREHEKHKPLSDLLLFTAGYAQNGKAALIRALARDLLRVDAFSIDDRFADYDFLSVGLKGYHGITDAIFSDANELIAVSPFLSSSVTGTIARRPRRKVLITRKSSVTPAIFQQFDEVYIIRDALLDDALLQEAEEPSQPKRDVHAKIYFKTSGNGNHLYLGSLNASANAFYHNVEFMIGLKFKPRQYGFTMVKEELIPQGNGPFEKLEVPNAENICEDTGEQDDLSDIVHALKTARAVLVGERYSVFVACGALERPAQIAPMYRQAAFADIQAETELPGLALRELSEFYVIRRDDAYAVVKITTQGIPVSERDKAIYNAIIGSRSGFMAYIAFMLADQDSYGEVSMELKEFMEALRQGAAPTGQFPAALYERMLRAVVDTPWKFDDIEDVMRRLDPGIVTDDFRKVVETFRSAARKAAKK